jgi:GT2 family glycosyltransferase
MERIAVLIPSYNRPEILEITLPRWLKAKQVDKIFVVAEASSYSMLVKYEKILEKYDENRKIVYNLTYGRLGSIKARNTLLDMAVQHGCEYVLMVDDDHLLISDTCLVRMIETFKANKRVGIVGGKVIVANRRRMDPDFFLNLPFGLTDVLVRLTGYVFLDIKHGPRYSEFLPPFFMMKKEVIDKGVRYDEILDSPTGFREESDLQLQIKNLGYKLLYDPRVYVIHLANERGGNRPKMSMAKRIYWKSLTHTVFILKWNKSFLRRIWYVLVSILILSFYRTWYISWIFKGVKDGIRRFSQSRYM